MIRSISLFLIASLFAICGLSPISAQHIPHEPKLNPITTPKAFFGFNMGDDYCLANYQQLKGYWEKIVTETDRMKLITIGKTEEGRPQLAAIVTSPKNHKKLDEYRSISRKLAIAEGVTAEQARALAESGKAVVWIDGGLHASETLCAQVLIETVYRFLAANDAETLRILDDVIILFVHANPDGHDLVADWYMKEKEPTKRTLSGLPRLYQKYIGHDNNRDFYANTQAETKNMNRLMYHEWFPQIMYNHHQSGPVGTVLFCPPFRDPFNYFCDPMVLNGIDAVGAAMVQRFLVEGKPGATIRSGAPYSTWFNGGLRTTASFHNMIGILTETIGSPTPTQIPLVSEKQLPKGDYLAPIPPQPWHFRQSVEYSVTANKAILDYASRHREQLLYNIWLMGHNAIEKGSRDHWTITPKIVAAATKERATPRGGARGTGGVEFDRHFRKPELRDARGYILPADQPDFLTATKFINALLGTGIQVQRAKSAFTVEGKTYPQGSYIVKTAQAFRAHVLDMFEPQDHPNDFAYPGGPPIRPYDSAGYTLAYQMGVKFDRILTGFEGPFESITVLELEPPEGKVLSTDGAVGFMLDHRMNDSYRTVNRLLKEKSTVQRLQTAVKLDGKEYQAGTFYIPASPDTIKLLELLVKTVGTSLHGVRVAPDAAALGKVGAARVALWDRHGGSMPSGWTRWILERFEFPFEVVFASDLEKNALREKYDVIILVDGAYSGQGGAQPMAPRAGRTASTPGRGPVSGAKAIAALREFLQAGGTILTIDSSTRLGRDLGLPVANYLVEKDDAEIDRPLKSTQFYIPSSVLRVKVDPTNSLAWGLDSDLDVMFSSSPTFRLTSGSEQAGLKKVAWFDSSAPLRSGWAWGAGFPRGWHRHHRRESRQRSTGAHWPAGSLPRPVSWVIQTDLQRDCTIHSSRFDS